MEDKDIPSHHFTQTDIDTHWKNYLEKLQAEKNLISHAIGSFVLKKTSEATITIQYASDASRSEFEKVQSEFSNQFRTSVHNQKVQFEFEKNHQIKKEIVTKRTVFEKMAKKNPALLELDKEFKLDLS